MYPALYCSMQKVYPHFSWTCGETIPALSSTKVVFCFVGSGSKTRTRQYLNPMGVNKCAQLLTNSVSCDADIPDCQKAAMMIDWRSRCYIIYSSSPISIHLFMYALTCFMFTQSVTLTGSHLCICIYLLP